MTDLRGDSEAIPPFETQLPELLETCARYLGEPAGSRLAATARPGFELHPVEDGPATGRSALGGPALLDPGTPWPEFAGFPLNLVAVLDTDPLASWLGDQFPRRVGLLNFFVLDPDVPYEEWQHADLSDPGSWRVVPADPSRAVEVSAHDPACHFDRLPLRAEPVATLPDEWDRAMDELDLGPGRGDVPPALALADSGFTGHWSDRRPRGHQAFGWPVLELGPIWPAEVEHTLLLKLVDFPIDRPVTWFTIPTDALRSADFSRAVSLLETF